MKIRILILAGLLVSNYATAADAAIAVVDGKGQGGAEGSVAALQPGQTISAGMTLETPPDSTLTLKLPNGKSLRLGPGSRIRVRTLSQSESNPSLFSFEIALLRGSLVGDSTGASTASNFTLRTTAGSANVAGAAFSVDFQPTSLTAGILKVLALSGNIALTPTNGSGPVSIPAGSQATAGGSAPSLPVLASEAELQKARDALAGNPGGTQPTPTPSFSPATSPGNTLPDLSIIVLSPNGEGSGL